MRSNFIDIVKGFTIMLVIYGHSMERSAGIEVWTGRTFFNDRIHDIIFTFHMPLFMALSGYLFYYSFNRHSFIKIVKSKFKSLLIPILTFGFLIALFTFNYHNISVLSSFKSIYNATTGNMWFLYAVLELSLLTMVLERFFKGNLFAYAVTLLGTLFTPPYDTYTSVRK